MFRWLNGPSNDLYRKGNKKAHIRLIFWLSVLFNALFFAAAIAHNPPAWYTNDDFRMMTIVSGAYTGTPSPDIVFMRYPVRAVAVIALHPDNGCPVVRDFYNAVHVYPQLYLLLLHCKKSV